MISAKSFINKAKTFGFGTYTGVPCSFLKPFINYIIDSDEVSYIPAPNEGDAIAIAGGAYLGGDQPIVMLQNSGLGNTINPITSLLQTFKIPCLIIVTLRGDPSSKPDEPQHQLMGKITQNLIELMELDYSFFPDNETDLENTLRKASSMIVNEKKSYVLIMKKGTVESYNLTSKSSLKAHSFSQPTQTYLAGKMHSRSEILHTIIKNTDEKDLIIATTGYTGRELAAIDDRSNQFYMVGSMGCAASIGLGIALNNANARVIVIDGDGGLLMHLGALSTIGFVKPKNFIHILLDNKEYESTGGQDTVSRNVDFPQIASSCGYERSIAIQDKEDLAVYLNSDSKELKFIYMPIISGVPKNLPRPKVNPSDIALRFRKHISQISND
jgi:phosphonopyruvate decarboxylase